MSVVEASRALRARGLTLALEGSGVAVSQRPAAGTFTAEGGEVQVRFSLP